MRWITKFWNWVERIVDWYGDWCFDNKNHRYSYQYTKWAMGKVDGCEGVGYIAAQQLVGWSLLVMSFTLAPFEAIFLRRRHKAHWFRERINGE